MQERRLNSDLVPAACALFHSFDLDDLCMVLELDTAQARMLLDGEELALLTANVNVFQLQPTYRAALLTELRSHTPQDEVQLHKRAFQHFLQRLQTDTNHQQARLEDACIYHLRALRDLNLDYMRWEEVTEHLAALRQNLPRPRPDHAACLRLIEAYHLMRRQEYARSEAILLELIATLDLPAQLRAEALLTHGLCQLNQAQLDQARTTFLAALELGTETNDHQVQGNALINISWIYNDLAQYETALRYSQQSVAHFQQASDLYGSAYALYSIGNNALSLGQWSLGEQHLDAAAAIYAHAGMEMRLATVEWARGLLHQMLGNTSLSEQAYQRTLAGALSAEYGNTVAAADSLIQLGILYQTTGQFDASATHFLQAIALATRLNDDLRRALLLYRLGQVHMQQGDTNAGLTMYAEAITSIESLRVSTEGEEIKLGLLGTTQQVYETAVLAHITQGEIATAFAYVERARARAFLDLVARRDGALDALVTYPTVELHELQACLAPGTLLLEYYTVGVIPAHGSLARRVPTSNTQLRAILTVEPAILLFAITTDSVVLHRIAVDPNLLQPPQGDPTPGWHLFTERKLSWLYTKLIAPVAELLGQYQRVQIIPHGPLHYVPFAALRTPQGTTLLAENMPAIAYAPSATVLCSCLARYVPEIEQNLALGYNSTHDEALYYAEHEAALIGHLTGGEVYCGSIPKRATLFEHAPQLTRLHIAGHAFFQADDPLGSFLRLGDADDVDARSLMQGLKLHGALVTLNACTSGLSQIASGDELLGLPRAFLYAGAATIVCALHEVDDLAASLLMFFFYTQIMQGQSPANALCLAQQSLRTLSKAEVKSLVQCTLGKPIGTHIESELSETGPFAHPRYWAPFIVIGKP